MIEFKVRALSERNVLQQLTVRAQDEADAIRQVSAQGYFAASARPSGGKFLSGFFAALGGAGGGGQSFSLLLFSQELLALLNAGLSIVEALEALLEKDAQDARRSVLTLLLRALRDGKRLSQALADQPGLFPAIYVGIVRTAEGTSDLPRSLGRFIDYQQRINGVRGKLVSAAIYPAILLTVGSLVSLFLIAYVVPRFAEVYQGTGRSLPWMSQLMLDWGRFATDHGSLLMLGAAAVIAASALMLRSVIAQRGVAALITWLPGLGERVRIFELSRLYLTLGILVEGGIPLVTSLEMVIATATAELRERLSASRAMVEAGLPLSAAFEAQQLTTPISLRMLRVGERSGEMGKLLLQSATFYDGEIARWIDRFMRTFEPLLMAVIGLVVGAIVMLLYMPIFDLAGSM